MTAVTVTTAGADIAGEIAVPVPAGEVVRVLFTCVDNRSRTILAQRLLNQHLLVSPGSGHDVRVTSAGGHKTHPAPGIHRHTAAELRRLGLDDSPAPAVRLRHADLTTADLVLVFEREHRTELFQYHPRLLHTCFTLTELAAIAAHRRPSTWPASVRERIALVATLRRLGADAPDIRATWRQNAAAHREAADLIEASVPSLAMLLS